MFKTSGVRIFLCAAATVAAGPVFALDTVDIRIVGVSDEVAKQLQGDLELASLTLRALNEEVTDAQDQMASARAEYRQMVSVLYGDGFFGPSVSVEADGQEVSDISPLSVPARIDRIVVTIDPGPQFTFGIASVSPREPTAAAAGDPPVDGFAPGEPARSGLIVAAANAAVGEWREQGHAKATVGDQNIIARHKEAQLDADVRLFPGPQLRFGKVTILGETNVKRKRIYEMLGLPEGELVTPEELNDAANRMRRVAAFKTVALQEADAPNPDGTLDFSLTVIDELPRGFGVSAEYSTLDGILLGGYWLHRNVFGGAEQFRVDAEVAGIGGTTGGVDYSTAFRLSRPAWFGPDNTVFLFGELNHDDEPDYVETQATIGLGVNRYFNDDLYGEVAGGFRYSYAEDAFGEREFHHVVLPSRIEWDKRDDEGDAKNGFYINAKAMPMLGVMGSEDLVQMELDNRAYVSFGASSPVTLAGRLQIGSILGGSLEGTPPKLLFYSGGGDTVRGQKYESLGGSEHDGDTVGGRSFVGISTELRTRITDSIGMVGFVDYGFVGSDSLIDSDSNEHSGIGLGLRYSTPIGPIRVDLATPYTGPDGEFSRVELYIGVGQAF